MVNLSTYTTNGYDGFVAPTHHLKSNKTLSNFKTDEVKECLIAKFSDGRFGVMACSYKDAFYKVFTEQELHDTFEEIEK